MFVFGGSCFCRPPPSLTVRNSPSARRISEGSGFCWSFVSHELAEVLTSASLCPLQTRPRGLLVPLRWERPFLSPDPRFLSGAQTMERWGRPLCLPGSRGLEAECLRSLPSFLVQCSSSLRGLFCRSGQETIHSASGRSPVPRVGVGVVRKTGLAVAPTARQGPVLQRD